MEIGVTHLFPLLNVREPFLNARGLLAGGDFYFYFHYSMTVSPTSLMETNSPHCLATKSRPDTTQRATSYPQLL
eukprot:1160654-Pelagomonas_calceolata.AAC.8